MNAGTTNILSRAATSSRVLCPGHATGQHCLKKGISRREQYRALSSTISDGRRRPSVVSKSQRLVQTSQKRVSEFSVCKRNSFSDGNSLFIQPRGSRRQRILTMSSVSAKTPLPARSRRHTTGWLRSFIQIPTKIRMPKTNSRKHNHHTSY